MKTSISPTSRLFNVGPMILVCLLAIPVPAEAKGPRGGPHGRSQSSKHRESRGHDRTDHDRQSYSSHPRSTFILSFGNGYAGSGYYYGPPNSPYYYQRSDVRYFATRESAPREYLSRGSYHNLSTEASVQRALATRGYYHGSIDGSIGPQSRRAIVKCQRDRGMRPTGYITTELLRSLGM